MYKCKWNNKGTCTCIKNKNNSNTSPSLFPISIMNRSCQTLFLLFMYFIAIATLSHADGLDSVERESSVGAFLLRLRLLTSLSTSHSQPLSGLCSPHLIFPLYTHSSCTWHVLRTELIATVSVDLYHQSLAKRGPYNHDGVPKITWIWGPRDAHIYEVCKFLWHRAIQ